MCIRDSPHTKATRKYVGGASWVLVHFVLKKHPVNCGGMMHDVGRIMVPNQAPGVSGEGAKLSPVYAMFLLGLAYRPTG